MVPRWAYVLVVALVGALIWRALKRPLSLKQEFDRWAQSNGLIVLRAQRRYIFAGPFIWKRSGIVYKIEVKSPTGQIRRGWIRFGYDFFSEQPWSEKVIWDNDALKAA